MSSSPSPAPTMLTEIATGWHVLKVESYSQMSGRLGVARRLKSWPFVVGGHTWCVTYFPDGLTEDTAGWISFALRLEQAAAGGTTTTEEAVVTVRASFSLLDDGGGRPAVPSHGVSCGVWTFSRSGQSWSHTRFMERKELESSSYMKDDGFRVRCDITVLSSSSSSLPPPQPELNLNRDLGELLASGDGADVTLDVGGESFRAHKNVLAARSPVFKAEFFGGPQYAEEAASRVRIHGVEPSVFRALLHYMYTDSLPPEIIDDGDGDDDRTAMAQHLLVAADRYGIERLKSTCELALLLTVVDVSAVVTTLVLAEQHGCRHLKEACIKVLKSSKVNNYKERVVGEDFQYLASTCPSLLQELRTRGIFYDVGLKQHDC